MVSSVDVKTCVVVPNWNGEAELAACLDSLLNQTTHSHIIVVDNGSSDGSTEFIEKHYPDVELIRHNKNKGYAGGVNPGLHRAIELGMKYAAPFNNDAVADPKWLEGLEKYLDNNPGVGIAACKVMSSDGTKLDSTGDYYTVWGLPYPRGRGEGDAAKYDSETSIFAASGAASLYRVKMLRQIGLFDEDFFAYYEDVDLSFRAQLAGWKVSFVPEAVVYHQISVTSNKMKGFATYQTIKNLPLLLWKNVPWRILPHVWVRLVLAWSSFVGRALSRGQIWPVAKGCFCGTVLWPKKLVERRKIQRNRKVSDEYIWGLLVHDLPPNAHLLRKLRAGWWKIKGRSDG